MEGSSRNFVLGTHKRYDCEHTTTCGSVIQGSSNFIHKNMEFLCCPFYIFSRLVFLAKTTIFQMEKTRKFSLGLSFP